ncbi:MAG: alpha/beta fold hydrolase [Chloroflexi bacterium]|nr:alpha/beta fold hydrolase [Chloroflexota bacterium]
MFALENPLTVRRMVTAGATILGLAGLLAALGEYGHRQITRSHRTDFRDDPGRWGLNDAQEIDLTTRDGVRLHSWVFRSPESVGSVIVLHGHGGNKHTVLPLARMLYPRYNVLLLDHRGHGDSDGLRTTIGYEERLDVHAAVEYLLEQGLGPVGIYGMSMGGATAILAAAEDRRISAVVADSPYARLRWAVGQVARLRGYPGFIAPGIAWIGCFATAFHLRNSMASFDPVEVVDQIAPRPLLLMHGTDDEIIPVVSARILYEKAGAPKELWLQDGLKHCRALDECFDEFSRRVVAFYDRWLAAPEHGAPPARPAGAATSSG